MTTQVENFPPTTPPPSSSRPGYQAHQGATPPTGGLGPAPAVRMAAAKSRTNRRLLIVGVLVVLIGGVVGLSAGRLLTRHAQVLAVARPVAAGTTITANDLTTANVTADPNLSPIPASQRAGVVGQTAQVALSVGELLTRSQIGAGSGFSPGQMLIALALKQGQYPARGLLPGQTVLVVATPGTNVTTTGGTTAAVAAAVPIAATVTEVGGLNPSTEITVIDVRVGSGDGVALTQLASTGNLALILLPAGR